MEIEQKIKELENQVGQYSYTKKKPLEFKYKNQLIASIIYISILYLLAILKPSFILNNSNNPIIIDGDKKINGYKLLSWTFIIGTTIIASLYIGVYTKRK